MSPERIRHTSHWGTFDALVDGAAVTYLPSLDDPCPSPLTSNWDAALDERRRVMQPYVRRSWLEAHGRDRDRNPGRHQFTPVTWELATELLASELDRVITRHGNRAIYGGSYGWGSAGRFHHAQSQVHRFLNCLGGYTGSVGTYSLGAGRVALQHILGSVDLIERPTSWSTLVAQCQLLVCFGGLPEKNQWVNAGGVSSHRTPGWLDRLVKAGCSIVYFSPLRDDVPERLQAEWIPIRPGDDMAVILALCFVLLEEGLADRAFLDTYCVGHGVVSDYLRGAQDGVAKSPAWAEAQSGVGAEVIRRLARRMASDRTTVNLAWAVQRASNGEAMLWGVITLAAMLGQVGLPGGGVAHGYGCTAGIGAPLSRVKLPTLPQGTNPVTAAIPVARIADALLNPGDRYSFDGCEYRYPDLQLIYWCGGNPFHHHQDLGRLQAALRRPEFIVVHEPFWTGMAERADLVLPASTTLERNDIGGAPSDPQLLAMHRVVDGVGESRSDFAIFADTAARLGVGYDFDAGRDEMGWLRFLYEEWRGRVEDAGAAAPPFEDFWDRGSAEVPMLPDDHVALASFRQDPDQHRLRTPSGKIELFSQTVHGFGYDEIPGHAVWRARPSAPALGERHGPLTLVTNNPGSRLHSQLYFGSFSQANLVGGVEPVRIGVEDAAMRGISHHQLVWVYNRQGAVLAAAVVGDGMVRGVAQMSTGAPFLPVSGLDLAGTCCVGGNVNVLTEDRGSSRLGQACSAHTTEVWIRPATDAEIRAAQAARSAMEMTGGRGLVGG